MKKILYDEETTESLRNYAGKVTSAAIDYSGVSTGILSDLLSPLNTKEFIYGLAGDQRNPDMSNVRSTASILYPLVSTIP